MPTVIPFRLLLPSVPPKDSQAADSPGADVIQMADHLGSRRRPQDAGEETDPGAVLDLRAWAAAQQAWITDHVHSARVDYYQAAAPDHEWAMYLFGVFQKDDTFQERVQEQLVGSRMIQVLIDLDELSTDIVLIVGSELRPKDLAFPGTNQIRIDTRWEARYGKSHALFFMEEHYHLPFKAGLYLCKPGLPPHFLPPARP
ncbi:hypothetical protein HYV73_04435 [Candidatus Uhrbacteria bacterium]|nr:hypothetical protein [Candidatus Uhrbacteria bacterium]